MLLLASLCDNSILSRYKDPLNQRRKTEHLKKNKQTWPIGHPRQRQCAVHHRQSLCPYLCTSQGHHVQTVRFEPPNTGLFLVCRIPRQLGQLRQLLIQRGREDELLSSLLLHSLPPPLPPALSGRKSERSSPAPCLSRPRPCPRSGWLFFKSQCASCSCCCIYMNLTYFFLDD